MKELKVLSAKTNSLLDVYSYLEDKMTVKSILTFKPATKDGCIYLDESEEEFYLHFLKDRIKEEVTELKRLEANGHEVIEKDMFMGRLLLNGRVKSVGELDLLHDIFRVHHESFQAMKDSGVEFSENELAMADFVAAAHIILCFVLGHPSGNKICSKLLSAVFNQLGNAYVAVTPDEEVLAKYKNAENELEVKIKDILKREK